MQSFIKSLAALLLFSLAFNSVAQEPRWVGAEKCKSCHEGEFKQWQGSHHDWAMKPAQEDSVLGDFNNASFKHFGQLSEFYVRDGQYFVKTDNQDGDLQEYKIAYTFGFYPLQQYLVDIGSGRYQALLTAWDSRPKLEGGQRWFHLYPDEKIPAGDPLHWTGAYFNWNSRCAECHSTKLERNYDPLKNQYNTTWSDINVACESCHGAGGQHVDWAKSISKLSKQTDAADKKIKRLDSVGRWLHSADRDTAKRDIGLRKANEVDEQAAICGSCHSRRRLLKEPYKHKAGESFFEGHSLQRLQEPLYHADGQIRDEVYVLGSFMQSKMYKQGVQCSNCHEPHSLKLRAPGNGVCAQCHKPSVFDRPEHHHHKAGSDGALCVNCHMPETTYMVVDPRRDHSLRIPRPDLSETDGTPNACTSCHEGKEPSWAAGYFKKWLLESGKSVPQTPVLVNQSSADIMSVIGNAGALNQATLLNRLAGQADEASMLLAQNRLHHDEPLVREAAVEFMELLPLPARVNELVGLLDEPVYSVRVVLGRVLSAVAERSSDGLVITASQRKKIQALSQEYWATLILHQDTAAAQINMGLFKLSRGEMAAAEKYYLSALMLESNHLGALLNLADLYRQQNKAKKSLSYLQQAVSFYPSSGAANFSLGLAWIRNKEYQKAMKNLNAAVQHDSSNQRYVYVYAVALNSTGNGAAAILELEKYGKNSSLNPGSLNFLAQLYAQKGDMKKARAIMLNLQGH